MLDQKHPLYVLANFIHWDMFEKEVRKADRRMRTIAGILLRKLMRDLPEENPYKELLDICMRFVNGEKYDGHKIDRAMEQVGRVFGRRIRILAGDRGYRGQEACGDTKIEIPAVPKSGDTAYAKQKKHKLFRKRAGIEPVIGHCKADHRLSRNFYKGLFGDSINVMLAAAAFNFKRVMNLLFRLILNMTNTVLVWLEMPVRKQDAASLSYQLCHQLCAKTF